MILLRFHGCIWGQTNARMPKCCRLQSDASLLHSLSASDTRDQPAHHRLKATCHTISWNPSLLLGACVHFVYCVCLHVLAKSITQPTPPGHIFTMQDTSCRNLATVLAGQSTVGTTLKHNHNEMTGNKKLLLWYCYCIEEVEKGGREEWMRKWMNMRWVRWES